jgi:hypothetical protein
MVSDQMRFLRGQFPTQVDMHVQRYSRADLVKHKVSMDRWCVPL